MCPKLYVPPEMVPKSDHFWDPKMEPTEGEKLIEMLCVPYVFAILAAPKGVPFWTTFRVHFWMPFGGA